MKIAIVTDDNETISYCFGKAMKYADADMTVDEGQIETGEIRDKTGHLNYRSEGLVGQGGHQGDPREKGCGRHSGENHWSWLKLIFDCKFSTRDGSKSLYWASMYGNPTDHHKYSRN